MEVTLKKVRLSMFNWGLFEKSAYEEGGKKKYRATFLMEKDTPEGQANIKKIKDAIQVVAKEKWADKADSTLASIEHNPNKFCFRDGETKPNLDGYSGNMFISTSNEGKITILDRDRTELTRDDAKPYSGCYVNAIIDIWAMPQGKTVGLHATVKGVQYHSEGDAFVGGKPADVDDFEDLSEGADADDNESAAASLA